VIDPAGNTIDNPFDDIRRAASAARQLNYDLGEGFDLPDNYYKIAKVLEDGTIHPMT
jgi:hypothetical protein